MSDRNPNLDVNALTDVLESAAAALEFVAVEMEEGAFAKPATADLPRQMIVLVSRACRHAAEGEGRRLEAFGEALAGRGIDYASTQTRREDAA